MDLCHYNSHQGCDKILCSYTHLEQSIQECGICGRQPLKNWNLYDPLKQIPFKFFKGYLPQILLGPFLNALFHFIHTTTIYISNSKRFSTNILTEHFERTLKVKVMSNWVLISI